MEVQAMAVTVWKPAGTCATDSTMGTKSWLTTSSGTLVGTEVSSNNDVFAATTASQGETSHLLRCTNFGFTSSDVPSGSTIDGIEIRLRRYRVSGTEPVVVDTNYRVVKGGTVQTTNTTKSGDWTTSEIEDTLGNSTYLGGTTFTQSDILSSGFGVAVGVTTATGRIGVPGQSHFIDIVESRVYYTPPYSANQSSMFLAF
jgi:hypothetical protein